MSEQVAILGGGIAGVSAAIALRLRGFDVQVYERHGSASHLGAGLVCWPNACFVLEQLGVLEPLQRVAGSPTAMERYSSDGTKLGSIDIERFKSLTGQPSLSVFRRDLHATLLARLTALEIEVHYDHEVASIDDETDGTVVTFANGKSICPWLILGAEGRMNSIARRFVTGQNEPRYQGFVNWIGTYEADEPLFEVMAIQDIWGVGLRFGIVPVSPTTAYWAGGATQPHIVRSSLATRQEQLSQLFSGWPACVARIVTSAFASESHEVHVCDHDPIVRWHRKNVLLLGDAAHAALPTSGQGACQALEDAWFLASTLAEATPQNWDADIFSRFTSLRVRKTSRIALGARSLAKSLFETDPIQCQRRDAQARSIDYSALADGMAQLWWAGLPADTSPL